MKKALLSLSLPLLALILAGCGGGGNEGDQSGQSSAKTNDSGQVTTKDGSASVGEDDAGDDVAYNGKLKVYYHNDAGNYANKRIWAWGNGVDGDEYMFDNQTSADSYGVYKVFDLSSGVWEGMVSTTFSFIIKEAGTWAGQSTDTICHFSKFMSNQDNEGVVTIYACDGEGGNIDTFATQKEALGDRIGGARFTSWTRLHVVGAGASDGRAEAEIGKIDSYELYAYDADYLSMDLETQAANKSRYLIAKSDGASVDANEIDIDLEEEVKPYLSYTIEARMKSDTSRVKSKIASFTELFDTENFVNKYTYTGDDLGCTADSANKQVTFKLWAPTSSRVQVRIYTLGTPGDMFEEFKPTNNNGKNYDMELGQQGVWQLTLNNFKVDSNSPKFYTYYVTNAGGTNEIIDPYATSTGLNGKRAAILDWSTVETPEGWDQVASGQLLTDIQRPNELSVYEVHVRDLTSDDTWTGEALHGTYNAFIEEGTTYGTVKTGFDHIKEMGVKAVQLLPVFDQDNDERWADENGTLLTGVKEYRAGLAKTAPAYNWGYNPQNFNSPEGSYSSNPCDGITKVKEMRNLVKKCADNDIRVIMDVVYNHFASVNGHPLNRIVPGYFLRLSEDGSAYDGTGCGNVTATERPMMSKFVVDSVKQWATNYKIKGFRFDLMGCIDVDTMRAVKDALYDIDPDIVVYGEGWAGLGDGGFYDVVKKHYPNKKQAALGHVYKSLYDKGKGAVGAFSNGFRNGVKGDTRYGDITPEWGYISTGMDHMNNDLKEKTGKGIIGGNYFNYNADDSGVKYGANSEQTVSYIACHDNYTLFDQLNWAMNSQTAADVDNNANVRQAAVSAMASVFLNQGIAFQHGGDEFFRQKIMKPGDPMWKKMEDSIIPYDEASGHTWVEGDGIKMSSGNYLVRNSYQYGDDVNSFKWDRKEQYKDLCAKVAEASALRNSLMGNVFGRSYADVDSGANNVFDSTYDDSSKPLIACYMGGKTDNAAYYIIYGGNFSDEEYKSLGCGACTINVLYSSNNVHYAGQSFAIESSVGAAHFEYMLVKVS